MKTELETEQFEIELTEIEIQNARERAATSGKNSTQIENIFRQIDGELDRLSGLRAATNHDQNAQLAEHRYIKNELLRLLNKLESELSDDTFSSNFHKLLAKLRG
jgi:CelD/BcsL family acetyltransferase involved in cellulose biosynthesis